MDSERVWAKVVVEGRLRIEETDGKVCALGGSGMEGVLEFAGDFLGRETLVREERREFRTVSTSQRSVDERG